MRTTGNTVLVAGGTSGIGRARAESFPDLNALVANAGISRAEDLSAGGWSTAAAEAVVETNVMGVLRLAAAFLPLTKGKPGAAVLVTTSNPAFVPRSDLPT